MKGNLYSVRWRIELFSTVALIFRRLSSQVHVMLWQCPFARKIVGAL